MEDVKDGNVQQAQHAGQDQQNTAQVPKRKVFAKKKVSKKTKIVIVKSKRKEAIARASIKPGTGKISINRFSIDVIEPQELRYTMLESINVSKLAGSLAKKVDITVNVHGGGISSQAQAVRGAIAKGLSEYSESDVIRKELMHYDRSMLVDDYRRVEPKKFKGPKARARFQTSYR
ncbi:MAG: 30S ribosomal protein S9 [Candidatus Micrarchaeia archaeon]